MPAIGLIAAVPAVPDRFGVIIVVVRRRIIERRRTKHERNGVDRLVLFNARRRLLRPLDGRALLLRLLLALRRAILRRVVGLGLVVPRILRRI